VVRVHVGVHVGERTVWKGSAKTVLETQWRTCAATTKKRQEMEDFATLLTMHEHKEKLF
jgi:hypothetical protein